MGSMGFGVYLIRGFMRVDEKEVESETSSPTSTIV